MMKDVERVEEILSSKEKFVKNVSDVKFIFKKFFHNTDDDNLIETTIYSAHTEKEIRDFYDIYKSRYGDMVISSAGRPWNPEVQVGKCKEWMVVTYREYDGYTSYANMTLKTY